MLQLQLQLPLPASAAVAAGSNWRLLSKLQLHSQSMRFLKNIQTYLLLLCLSTSQKVLRKNIYLHNETIFNISIQHVTESDERSQSHANRAKAL